MLLCVREEATESVLIEIILLMCTLPIWGRHRFFSLPESPRALLGEGRSTLCLLTVSSECKGSPANVTCQVNKGHCRRQSSCQPLPSGRKESPGGANRTPAFCHFADKGPSGQSYGFSTGPLWM